MATITSAQTGIWHDTTTWVGGVIPDPWVDDVVIATEYIGPMVDKVSK